MAGKKFGPVTSADDGALPELRTLLDINGDGCTDTGRTVLDNRDGTRWTLEGTQECRKMRWQRINGKRVKSPVARFATLGLFSRPCAAPGCRGKVQARVSLSALANAILPIGTLEVTRCAKCRKRRAQRSPEQIAADRKAARKAYDARRYAERKGAA